MPSLFRQATPRAVLFLAALLLLIHGGAEAGQRKDIVKFNELYEKARYGKAADFELKRIGGDRADKAKLLQSMQAAAALRFDDRLELSSRLFDESESILKEHDEKLFASRASSSAGAVLFNDNSLDYRGTVYDGVMVNTYKALNFWQEGRPDLARVEFNRALDRQRRAMERFAAEIERLKKEIDSKRSGDGGSVDLERSAGSPRMAAMIRQNYSSMFEFAAYPDFVNPFTTYAAGLFFLSQEEYAKAATLLKEAAGMTGGNAFVLSDFVEAEGLEKRGRHVWVVFENGSGPVLEELRVDIPLYLVTRQVKYTGIALPKMVLRDKGCERLLLRDGEEELGSTAFLSSMDRVVMAEFKKRYPAILRRAILSAAVKTVAQNQAQKHFGDIGGILGGIVQRATTIADTRMWTALPKEFQVARVPVPAGGVLTLETPEGGSFTAEVPTDGSSLVYVKIPAYGARPYCSVTPMDGRPVDNTAVMGAAGEENDFSHKNKED
ncbi:hypothetical protein [Chlorobium sp. N1]|uniref:hypothetical protein n=1 Tax=Chlorobium sp. N1 TaxID=2491138 RepID=UPI001A94B540|nr:hypothetical protein [Chlorobium sp. N1]